MSQDYSKTIAVTPDRLQPLLDVLRNRRLVILTGAGCSTESGIPDYRGPMTRHKARNPIQYKTFVSEHTARQRYWARSVVGWQRVDKAEPNAAHRAIAQMETAGLLSGVITQNVDRLHHRAGNRNVVELHGTLSEVYCLSCQGIEQRRAFQHRLEALNPGWKGEVREMAPDGDAELHDADIRMFRVPDCSDCGGILKPNVVFFGESVPKYRVEAAWSLYDEAEALLIVGSSLAVYSGYRFVLRAAKDGRVVAMVNLGESRGDKFATAVVNEQAGSVLPRIAEAMAR